MLKLTFIRLSAALALVVPLAACQQEGSTTDEANETEENVAEQASPSLDMSAFITSTDTDGDGRMSAAEWTAQSLPEESFTFLAGEKDHVTAADFAANPSPEGVDLNADGAVTLDEFKAFAAKVADAPPIG